MKPLSHTRISLDTRPSALLFSSPAVLFYSPYLEATAIFNPEIISIQPLVLPSSPRPGFPQHSRPSPQHPFFRLSWKLFPERPVVSQTSALDPYRTFVADQWYDRRVRNLLGFQDGLSEGCWARSVSLVEGLASCGLSRSRIPTRLVDWEAGFWRLYVGQR